MAHFKLRGAIAGLSMAMASMPAHAAPSCWADREVSAAQVRQMQTMLMVAALRCRAGGIDIAADYNAFVGAERDQIAAANLVIKQHFAQTGGNQTDYDRFATALANGYGAGETSEASCADAASAAHEASASGNGLQRVAAAHLFPAALPGGVCAAPAAMLAAADASGSVPPASPAPAPAPIVMLAAAPVASPAPVTLPNDVTAALTVLARYRAAQTAAVDAPVTTQVAAVQP